MLVTNIKVVENKLVINDELKRIIELMPKGSEKLLPNIPTSTVSFSLKNSYSSFANAIRRVLVEELDTYCLHLEEKSLETNDDFILSDVFIKNINLIPINQELDMDEISKLSISLRVFNDSKDIIDVKASDIKIKNTNTNLLISNDNIILMRLRPGKFINVTAFTVEVGKAKTYAAKFTLLNNVSYKITDVEPYDQFKNTGTRSIDADCKNFDLSFTTSGNISPKIVINRLTKELNNQLNRCREKIVNYSLTDGKYYFSNGLEVTTVGDVRIYKFINEYITFNYTVAHKCYLLDKNITYCSRSVSRYDNEVAIIKMTHPNCNKLLLSAIDEILLEVEQLRKALLDKL
jgi:hypothetical protein